jgi:hypothetical protein
LEHSVQILHDVVIYIANDLNAKRVKVSIALPVIDDLRVISMALAIYLDD